MDFVVESHTSTFSAAETEAFSAAAVAKVRVRLRGAGVAVMNVGAVMRLGRMLSLTSCSAGDPFSVTPCKRVYGDPTGRLVTRVSI